MEQTKARQMKLTQLVKEFGVNGNELKQKDIIDLLKTVGIEKKTGGALEGEELDLFLTVMTLGNQLNNMKDYLTGKAILDSELPKPEKIVKPAPKKPEPKPEAKPASPAPKGSGLQLGPGMRVRHAKFGEGIVLSVSGSGTGQIARIDFEATGQKQIAPGYAPLEILP